MKKIPIPVVYKKEKRANNITENDGFGIWKRQTIKGILTNEMYIGNMVQNTFNKISYNSKKTRKTRDEEKIIVKNTHDSIISQEKFDKVQKILNERSDKYKKDSYVREGQLEYLLGGLLYCKDCGRSIRISKDILKGTIRHYTQCNLYTRKGKYGICSSHRINYDWLEEDVIEYLQQLCEQFCKQYDFSEIEDNSDNIIIKKIEEIKIKQKNIEDGIKAINTTIDNLYIDKTKGLVDEEMYKRIYSKSKAELLKYEITLKQINKDKSIYDQKNHAESSFTKCKSAVLKYMALKEPTRDQIIRLIKKIEIDSERKIYVYLKFKEMEVKQ